AANGVSRVFSEKISTRATQRPELEKAVTLARELRASGGGPPRQGRTARPLTRHPLDANSLSGCVRVWRTPAPQHVYR
ncbi:hypothetical protein ABZS96_44055, partial [Streptomyces avermitilis]